MAANIRQDFGNLVERVRHNILTQDEKDLWEDSTLRELFFHPQRFDFAQAVRLLCGLLPHFSFNAEAHNDEANPQHFPVHFKSHIGLQHKSSELFSIEWDAVPENPPILTLNFLSIAGIYGPLPYAFTEFLMDRLREKDHDLTDFLTIFHHRMGLFWFKLYTLLHPVLLDQPLEKTHLGQCLVDLNGHKGNDNVDIFLPITSFLWQKTSSRMGLEWMINTTFKVSCHIQPLMGGWNHIQRHEQTRLGTQYTVLGMTAVLGEKSYASHQKFRIFLGPLPYDQFQDFSPNDDKNSGYHRLFHLVQAYFSCPHAFDIALSIHQNDRPSFVLGHKHMGLGRSTWLQSYGKALSSTPKTSLKPSWVIVSCAQNTRSFFDKKHAISMG